MASISEVLGHQQSAFKLQQVICGALQIILTIALSTCIYISRRAVNIRFRRCYDATLLSRLTCLVT